MPGPTTRILAVGAAAVAAAIAAAPAAARSTLVDDDAPVVRRALAAGLAVQGDNAWQAGGGDAVFGAARQVGTVPAAQLLGLSAPDMAQVLRDALAQAGGHYVNIDDAGAAFRGDDGTALAAALGLLGSGATPAWADGVPLARRVHLLVGASAGTILTDPALSGVRTAMTRAGGLWMKTSGWTTSQWLTWPAEAARQISARGVARSRLHVAMQGADQKTAWSRARTGSACAILSNGPAAFRLGGAIEAFVSQYRYSFTFPAVNKSSIACTAAPVLPRAGASALVAAERRETTGLEIPAGGLVTPPLVAGEPAQVTLQLGDDPLGLAAGLGLTPEEAWTALAVIVRVRGAGVSLDTTVGGDGAAQLAFTPTTPGPIAISIVVRGSRVSTALGAPTDMVDSLAATAGSASLLSRVVAAPDGWALQIPLYPTGGAVGDPPLVIVPPLG